MGSKVENISHIKENCDHNVLSQVFMKLYFQQKLKEKKICKVRKKKSGGCQWW